MALDQRTTEALASIGIKITKEHDDFVIFQDGKEIFSSPCEKNLMAKLRRVVQQLSQDCVDLMQDLDPERYQQFVGVAQLAAGWVMQGLLRGDVRLALQMAARELLGPQPTFPILENQVNYEVVALVDGAWAVIQSWGRELP